MSKNNSKKITNDFINNINKITFIGLTCMAALGTSMIIMECNASKSSSTSRQSSQETNHSLNQKKSLKTVNLLNNSKPILTLKTKK